jgi:hypothetical protein
MIVKFKLYGSAGSIGDTDIAGLNSILIGFSSSQLSSLVFTTTTSIGALGALNGWSSSQVFNYKIFKYF